MFKNFVYFLLTVFIFSCGNDSINNSIVNNPISGEIFIIKRIQQSYIYSTYTIKADGTNKILINDSLMITSPSYAGKITLARVDSVYYFNKLYTANVNGTNIVNVPRNNYYPVYYVLSPRGDKVLFTTDAGNYLCVVNCDGTNFIQISDGIRGTERVPKFSPDGNKIAFFEAPANLQTGLFVINIDGSNKTLLWDNIVYNPAAMLDWSPDGSKIVFENGNAPTTKICVIDTSGNNYTELTEGINPSWSKDGLKIAYLKNVNQGIFDVFMMNANGSFSENISNTPTGYETEPYFSPVNLNKILYSTTSGLFGSLKIFDVNSHINTSIADSITWGFWRY